MSRPKVPSHGQSKAEVDFLARPAKEVILPPSSCDDCHQAGGTLLFRPDGTGTWTCRTRNRSTQYSTIWRTDFALRDAHGATLFGVGPFFGPSMRSGQDHHIHSWERHFEFPVAYFSEIASATQNFGCQIAPCYASREYEASSADSRLPLLGKLIHKNAPDATWAAGFRAFACL